jgi:hypothetical protein
MFGMVRTIFISAIVHQAPLLVIASEWWLAKHSSKNIGMRSRTELPHYDNFWASGSVLGVSAGLAIVLLMVQSSYGVATLDPRTWPTVESIKRLAGWLSSSDSGGTFFAGG